MKSIIVVITILLIIVSCDNSRIIAQGNKVFYFRISKDKEMCQKLRIGFPGNRYERKQNLIIFYKNGDVIDFSKINVLLMLYYKYNEHYEYCNINYNIDGRSSDMYPYRKNCEYTSEYSLIDFRAIELIFKNNKIDSIVINSCDPSKGFYYRNFTKVTKGGSFDNDKFIIGIKVDDIYIPFPSTAFEISKILGYPQEEITYLVE